MYIEIGMQSNQKHLLRFSAYARGTKSRNASAETNRIKVTSNPDTLLLLREWISVLCYWKKSLNLYVLRNVQYNEFAVYCLDNPRYIEVPLWGN